MSKVAKIIGQVAGVVAMAAGIALLFVPGGQVFGVGLLTIAGVASAVSAGAMAIAQATMKPPDMQGTVNQVMIGANMPVPYAMGRTLLGGNMVYDDSADGPDNDERTQIFVYSVAGPIDSFEALQADYTTISFSGTSGGLISGEATGYYDNFLWANSRKGERPDTALTAVTGMTGAIRGWTSAHKLSGCACAFVTMEFDEDGKRWASGVPAWAMIGKWVKVYDPRLDTTYPGGSGAHRWDDEDTWEWSENPALHALAYARGRFVEGIRVVGVGLAQDQINVARFVELANICEANGWVLGGAVYEAPGLSKWDNLKRILQAAASQPLWARGQLDIKMSAPVISLDTITADDLADGAVEVTAMKSWRDRANTIVGRFRSEAHRWDYVQIEAVTDSGYVTEDGETKTREIQFDLCQDKDQAAELAAYELVNGREFGPIQLTVKPRLMAYRPGEALTVDIPEAGLVNELAIITGRSIDPGTGAISLILESETDAKHDFALGRTGTAPPTPTILTPEDADTAIVEQTLTVAEITQLIYQSTVSGLTFSVSSAGAVTISAHDRIYSDKTPVAVNSGSLSTGADADDLILVYYDDPTRAGGAVTYQALVLDEGVGETDDAFASATNPYRHFVAIRAVPATGTSGGGSAAGSGGGAALPSPRYGAYA